MLSSFRDSGSCFRCFEFRIYFLVEFVSVNCGIQQVVSFLQVRGGGSPSLIPPTISRQLEPSAALSHLTLHLSVSPSARPWIHPSLGHSSRAAGSVCVGSCGAAPEH